MDGMYSYIDKRRAAHNRKAVAGNEAAAQEAFRRVLGEAPTEDQIAAILAENSRILISGAPSTGKSTALRAKAEYIKGRGFREGTDYVFLRGADLKGFADFACKILEQCGAPAAYKSLGEDLLPERIRSFLAEKSADPSYRGRLIDYYLKFHVAGHTAFEYKEYKDYQKFNRIVPARFPEGRTSEIIRGTGRREFFVRARRGIRISRAVPRRRNAAGRAHKIQTGFYLERVRGLHQCI